MNPKLSIIVPIYNIIDRYLTRCIQSIVQQSLTDIEVLLINDGSCESNVKICETYALQDKRIQLIHQNNQGVSVARNVGIERATADWIMFVDADDYLESTICEKAYNKALEYDADIVQFGYRHIDESIQKSMNIVFGDDREVFLSAEKYRRSFIENILHVSNELKPMYLSVPWGKIIRKKLIQDFSLQFIPGLIRMQDMIFTAYLFQHISNMLYIDVIGYNYNKNSASITKRYNPQTIEVFTPVFENLLVFLQKHYPSPKDSYLQIGIGYIILTDCLKLQILHENNKVSIIKKYTQIKKLFNLSLFNQVFKHTTYTFLRGKRKLYYLLYFKLYSLIIIFKNRF